MVVIRAWLPGGATFCKKKQKKYKKSAKFYLFKRTMMQLVIKMTEHIVTTQTHVYNTYTLVSLTIRRVQMTTIYNRVDKYYTNEPRPVCITSVHMYCKIL